VCMFRIDVHIKDRRVTYIHIYTYILEHTPPAQTQTSRALPTLRVNKHTHYEHKKLRVCAQAHTSIDTTICLHSTLFPYCEFITIYMMIYLLSHIYLFAYYIYLFTPHRTRHAKKKSTHMHVCVARANTFN
jgi:hypothetical protein